MKKYFWYLLKKPHRIDASLYLTSKIKFPTLEISSEWDGGYTSGVAYTTFLEAFISFFAQGVAALDNLAIFSN